MLRDWENVFIIGNWRETTKIRDLGSVCISVDLLPIQLKLRDDVYSLDKVKLKFGLLDCVLSLCRGFRYTGVLFYTFYCNFGRAEECHSLYDWVSLYRGSIVAQ